MGNDRNLADLRLLGGAYLSLGRFAELSGHHNRAVALLGTAMDLGAPGGTDSFLDLLLAEAERFMRQADYYEAIRHWQDIASLLGDQTPKYIYHRLGEAYALHHDRFGGSPIENFCWGDRHKHSLLAEIHERLEPRLYLEIGVDEGKSLALAHCQAIGIDARPNLELALPVSDQTRLVALSSDAFFREQAADLLLTPPDLAFIDGLHLFEFALRDFMNVERYAGPTTLVVIDDIYPCHPAQASRRRVTSTWTGDVWKLHQVLREHRPDLILLALNTHPTGVLVIAGLDPANRVLWERYETLARSLRGDRPPPLAVLERHGALPSVHPVLERLLVRLHAARAASWDHGQVRQMLQTEFQEWLQGLVSEFSARSAREAAEITMPPPAGRLADRPFAQLYLPQADDMGFTELASIKSELSPGQWQDLLFKLPESSARVGGSPRFDPVNRAGMVQIDQLCLMDLVSDTVLFSLTNRDMEAAFHLAGDASPCQEQGIFTLYALGDDPQVFLPAIPRLNAGNVDLALHVRLRFIADSAELRDQWTANCNQRTEKDAEAVPYQLPEAQSTGTETEYGQSTALMPESSSLSVSADAVGSIAWLEQQLDEKLTLLAGFERRQVG